MEIMVSTVVDGWANAGLTIIDVFLIGFFFLFIPLESFIIYRRFRNKLELGQPNALLRLFRYSITSLWVCAFVVLVPWMLLDRSWSDLGFRYEHSLAMMITWGVVALILFAFSAYWMFLKFSSNARMAYQAALAEAPWAQRLMPKTRQEHRTFQMMGITAGITEEIIYRGYLIWALSALMTPWLAAFISYVLFVLMHGYQGKSGMMQVAVIGAIVTVLYLVTQSLYPVILLHIGIDLLAAAIFRAGTKQMVRAEGDEGVQGL